MARNPPARKVHIRTFGCQMNEVDSGRMRSLLRREGYEPVDDPEQADLVLINTCSVREKPEQKLHSLLGELRPLRERGVRIGIAGCMAQHAGEALFRRYRREVDLVFGPDQVPRVAELVRRAETRRVLANQFVDDEAYVFTAPDPLQASPVTAFVTIQKGCDNKCTFCIVPATRGPELSRPHEDVLAEVREAVARGAREITLLGQNVNSYGLKRTGGVTFARLLHLVAEVPGVERIRFTTSHPRDVTAELIDAYRRLPQLCSHLHLPVQSGSDRILRRMKRFYTRDHVLRLVDALRQARPDLALTTDVIVGFPGETDRDFEDTMDLLERVRFQSSFSFRYSPRPGTAALRLKDPPVPAEVASERLQRFQARQREITLQAHRAMEGQVHEVLVEGPSRLDPAVQAGRTSTFVTVNFPGASDLVGRIVPVRILRGFANSLRGERVGSSAR